MPLESLLFFFSFLYSLKIIKKHWRSIEMMKKKIDFDDDEFQSKNVEWLFWLRLTAGAGILCRFLWLDFRFFNTLEQTPLIRRLQWPPPVHLKVFWLSQSYVRLFFISFFLHESGLTFSSASKYFKCFLIILVTWFFDGFLKIL